MVGEDTSKAFYQKRVSNNDVLGYPGIVGSLDVTTKANWNVEGAAITPQNKTANATFSQPGTYKAELTLQNRWGRSNHAVRRQYRSVWFAKRCQFNRGKHTFS